LLIDYYGTWIEDYPSHLPPTYYYDASLVTTWNSWLKRADYLVLFSPDSGAYPRSPSVINLLHENYRLVYSNPGTYVYCDIKNSSSSSTAANADLEQGVAAQREQELTLAVTDYDNSLSLMPCDVPALYDLGLVNETRGNTENAIALYEEVLALDPHYEPAMNNLSKLS
jgi:Flp pilus assembly protein TadD